MRTVLFVLISFAENASVTLDDGRENLMFELSRQGAQHKINTIKDWVNGPPRVSDLDREQKCEISGLPFDPKFETPNANSKLVRDLCDLLPPDRSSIDGKRLEQECAFTRYTDCEIEFKKRIQVSAKGFIRRFLWGAEKNIYGPGNVKVEEVVYMAIRCQPIHILGVIPTWVCGSDYRMGKYVEKELKFEGELQANAFGDSSRRRYGFVNSQWIQRKFLEKLNLPSIQ